MMEAATYPLGKKEIPERFTQFLNKIDSVFDRVANVTGKELLIHDTFVESFNIMVARIPEEDQNRPMVKIQKALVSFSGYVREYGARLGDFVRNVACAPMILADKDHPTNDRYIQSLGVAKAWGNYAIDTQTTATIKRESYRTHFLPTVATGAINTSIPGTFIGASLGLVEGVKYGALTGGLYGALAGAGIGAVGGALAPIIMTWKDKLMGKPVLYYSIINYLRSSGGRSSIDTTTSNAKSG